MDGNGRWATARHRPRVFGHQAGVKAVRRIVEDAADLGVKYLTLYSFSTENWNRPKAEIFSLFNLLKQYVEADLETLYARNVRVNILGRKDGLKADILSVLERVQERTRENDGFFLNIAFNYGGRDEILRAFQSAAQNPEIDAASITEHQLSALLDTKDTPDPDLVIRTSGEKRVSNFLLWQAAYAEFVFQDVLWPDYSKSDLESAISEFQSRRRRFGAVDEAEVA